MRSSALDHAVYFVAKRHLGAALTPEIESSLMFPIVGHETIKGDPADGLALFQNQINSGRLRGLPQDALNFVESEQPFRWGQDGYQYHQLWTLHHLNRIDKHRRLALTTAWLDLPAVTVPDGVDPQISWKRAEGPVRDGDVLVTYSGGADGVTGHFGRAVAIDEGVARGEDMTRSLHHLLTKVHWVAAVLVRY